MNDTHQDIASQAPRADDSTLAAEVEALWSALQSGQLAEAHRRDASLRQQGLPPNARWLHAQAMLALADGKTEQAITALRASLELNPASASAHYHLGRALRAVAQYDLALAHYDHSLALEPSQWDVHSSRGVLLRGMGRLQESIAAQRAALVLQPRAAEVHFNLANALFADNQAQMAIAAYRHVLTLQPEHGKARRGLLTAQGYVLLDEKRWTEAITLHLQLVAEYPDVASLQNGLAVALWQVGDFDGARAAVERAHTLDPGDGFACLHSGMLLNRRSMWSQALPWLEMACERLVDFPPALIEWGIALLHCADYQGALQKFDAACAADPTGSAGPYHRAFALLMLGQMEQGYRDFEHRFVEGYVYAAGRPQFPMPAWNGEDLAQRHLLVWTEQGAGDALQYARYLPHLADRHPGHLSVRVHAALCRLLRHSFPDLDLAEEKDALLTPADYECPLMSLPMRLGCEEDRMAIPSPYLRCPPELVTDWHTRLGLSPRLRIGLAWSGNPDQQRNAIRSIPFDALVGLIERFSTSGECEFHVLQKGAGLEAMERFPKLPLIRSSEHCHDFADTGALMEALDLIITVDTSVGHLAGALARPTWILLARVPDWRYGPEGTDCVWYPTARVFRQPAQDDWTAVITEVSAALAALLAERNQTERGAQA